MPVVRSAFDENLFVEHHVVIVVLAEEIEVRECIFRERNSDIFKTLVEKVFVFEVQLFGLHAGTIMNENILSRPNTTCAVNAPDGMTIAKRFVFS
jgi:hypothetical protein